MSTSIKKPDEIFKQVEESFYLYFRMITQSSYSFDDGFVLTATEVNMLSRIEQLEIATVTKLSKGTGVTKGGISRLISKLEKKKLIVKEPDVTHGSRVLIKVTNHGKKIIEKNTKMHAEHNSHMMAFLHNLSAEELNTVTTFVDQMHQWLILFSKKQDCKDIDNE